MNIPLIFVSYSHRDEAEKDRLLSHIRAALQPGFANIFSDARIGAGVDWERKLVDVMDGAKVAILLITADYLNSEFIIEKEVKRLLERGEREGLYLFPVLAKACAWTRVEWLRKLNVIPRNGRPIWSDGGAHVEEDLAGIAEEVADVVEKERIAAPAPVAQPGPPTPPSGGRGEDDKPALPRVLLVDNEARFRRSVKANLEDFVTLVEAGSVKEAVRVLDSNQDIRVILLDLDLGAEEDGTALLEHIKGRASDYRVIILTAHQELLAANRASSYKVFRYLAKVEDDAPREMLWYNIENALSDLKRETAPGTHEFGEELVKMYPTPFLHLYQYLKSYIPPGESLAGQKDMLELLLNFSGMTLLCEYLYGDHRNDELDAHIRGRLFKPSLGDWFNIINEIVKRKGAFTNTFFLNSFLTFYTGRNKKNINQLISVRNRYVGHGPRPTDFELEKVVKECDELLVSLLRDYQIITNFLMCYTLSVQKLRNGYVYNLKECTGANHRLLNSRKSFNFLLNAEEMHLVNLDTEQYQSLHPFIILENCGDCKQQKIFFYSKFSNDQLHYLSYDCGHWITKEHPEEEFLRLIKMGE